MHQQSHKSIGTCEAIYAILLEFRDVPSVCSSSNSIICHRKSFGCTARRFWNAVQPQACIQVSLTTVHNGAKSVQPKRVVRIAQDGHQIPSRECGSGHVDAKPTQALDLTLDSDPGPDSNDPASPTSSGDVPWSSSTHTLLSRKASECDGIACDHARRLSAMHASFAADAFDMPEALPPLA